MIIYFFYRLDLTFRNLTKYHNYRINVIICTSFVIDPLCNHTATINLTTEEDGISIIRALLTVCTVCTYAVRVCTAPIYLFLYLLCAQASKY